MLPFPAYAEGQTGTGKLLQAERMQRFSLASMTVSPRDMLRQAAPCMPFSSSNAPSRPAAAMLNDPVPLHRACMKRKEADDFVCFFLHFMALSLKIK